MQVQKSQHSVIGIVFTADRQKVLLIKRRDVPVWALPGGGVDANETPQQAVIREIKEESGLTTRITRQIAHYTPLNRLTRHTHVFECTVESGSLSTGDETLKLGFFSLNCLPIPFFFLHRDWLGDAMKQHPGIINKPITQVTYFKLFLYFCRHPIQVTRMVLSRFGYPINNKD